MLGALVRSLTLCLRKSGSRPDASKNTSWSGIGRTFFPFLETSSAEKSNAPAAALNKTKKKGVLPAAAPKRQPGEEEVLSRQGIQSIVDFDP